MIKDKQTRVLVIFQMVLISCGAISIPALITTFQQVYNLTISQSAVIPVIGTAAGFLTNMVIASFSARVGLKRLNLLFLLVNLIAAIVLASTNNLYLFLLGIILMGIGTAFGLSNTSTVFAHINKKFQNYGVFHAFFGVGGVISPLLVSYLLKNDISYRYFYLFLAIFTFVTLMVVLFSKMIENHTYETIRFKEALQILKKPFVLPVLIIITIQSGSEQSAVMWAGNLFDEVLSIKAESASLYLSFYWIVFTISRLSVQLVEAKFGKLNTTKLAVFLAILSIAVLLITSNAILFLLFAAAVGPVFPLIQKYAAQKLPDREVGLFNGLVFAAASIGTVPISGIMGLLGDFNTRYSYVFLILTLSVVMIFLFHLSKLKKSGVVQVTK